MLSPTALQELQEALAQAEADLAVLQEHVERLRAVIAYYAPKSSPRNRSRETGNPASSMQHIRDASERVLQDAGEPLHYREIHRRLVERGITVNGKDPGRVLGAQLSADHERFKSIGGGKWTLVAGFPDQRAASTPAPVPFTLPVARATDPRTDSGGAIPPRPTPVPRQLPPWEDGDTDRDLWDDSDIGNREGVAR